MKLLTAALWICLFCTVSVYAQPATAPLKSVVPNQDDVSRKGDMARIAQKKSEERFDSADEDKDGQLSRAEVAKHLPYFDANFERYDKNKDGVLSWAEFVGHDKWKRQPTPK